MVAHSAGRSRELLICGYIMSTTPGPPGSKKHWLFAAPFGDPVRAQASRVNSGVRSSAGSATGREGRTGALTTERV